MLQHAASASMGSASASGSSSNSSRQHRNERSDRNAPPDRTVPSGAQQRSSNGPLPSKSSSNSNTSMLQSMRPQAIGSTQPQSRHGSSASSSSMPGKSEQRQMTKEHKSHPEKNLAMKHPLSSKSTGAQQHYSGSR